MRSTGWDDHGNLGMLSAQVQQAGDAVYARHGQIEQNEVHLACSGQPLGQLVERSGFQDFGIFEGGAERLAERAPEQGMIIDDDESVNHHAPHSTPGPDWRPTP